MNIKTAPEETTCLMKGTAPLYLSGSFDRRLR